MSQKLGCVHDFAYLLKQHEDGNFTGRVLELPAVIASGSSRKEIDSRIKDATLVYLHTFTDEHDADLKEKLPPKLITPPNGVILETIPYKVKC